MRTLNDTPTGLPEPTPGFTPGPGPTGEPKPYYREGTPVFYQLAPGVMGTGQIRGLASQNVIDMWIVERDHSSYTEQELNSPSVYPWSAIVVPHTALKRI